MQIIGKVLLHFDELLDISASCERLPNSTIFPVKDSALPEITAKRSIDLDFLFTTSIRHLWLVSMFVSLRVTGAVPMML